MSKGGTSFNAKLMVTSDLMPIQQTKRDTYMYVQVHVHVHKLSVQMYSLFKMFVSLVAKSIS